MPRPYAIYMGFKDDEKHFICVGLAVLHHFILKNTPILSRKKRVCLSKIIKEVVSASLRQLPFLHRNPRAHQLAFDLP